MITGPRARLAALIAAGLAAAAVLTGCSVGNAGGDTTCQDFLAQDEQTRGETVEKWLESEDQTANGFNINALKLAAATYCNTVGRPDSKLKDMRTDADSILDGLLN